MKTPLLGRRAGTYLGVACAMMALTLTGCAPLPPVEIARPAKPGAAMVVFDIDGTLTPKNWAIYEARPDAAQAVKLYAQKGYHVVYLSARVPAFQSMLPDWLQRHGFPPGTLHVAQTSQERTEVATYKARMLERYVQSGWRLAYAFGDSSTDFEAYARAGLPKERVFALKRRGDDDCQPGVFHQCLAGWTEHLATAQQVPAAP